MATDFEQGLDKREPYDIEAERAVIGCMLSVSSVIDKVIATLPPVAFYSGIFRFMYNCIIELQNDLVNVDLITVRSKMIQKGKSEAELTNEFFIDIINTAATSANINDYCNIIIDKYILRKTIEACDEIRVLSYKNENSAKEVVRIGEKLFFDLSKDKNQKEFLTSKELMPEVLDRINKAAQTKDGITGIRTGFRDMDNLTAGFQRSNFIVLGARPGEGKTSLAMNLAFNMAKKYKYNVAFFSLEMTGVELYMRLTAMESHISSDKLRSGRLTEEQIEEVVGATVSALNIPNLFINESSYLTISELRSECRKLKSENKLDIVMIDYLQLMHAGLDGYQNAKQKLINNRQEEVAEISRSLKALAKELDVPILALAQLKRESEGKKPQMSDLRESGAIEQDADVIMFISKEKENDSNKESDSQKTEIIFAKHRNGRTDSVFIRFDRATTKFSNYSNESPD